MNHPSAPIANRQESAGCHVNSSLIFKRITKRNRQMREARRNEQFHIRQRYPFRDLSVHPNKKEHARTKRGRNLPLHDRRGRDKDGLVISSRSRILWRAQGDGNRPCFIRSQSDGTLTEIRPGWKTLNIIKSEKFLLTLLSTRKKF